MDQNTDQNETTRSQSSEPEEVVSPSPVELIEKDPAGENPTEVEELHAEIDAKRTRINELAKGIQTLQDDFETRLKRIEREKDRAVELAKGQLLEKLAPVLDQFQLSVEAMKPGEANDSVRQGVQLIYKQFLDQLQELGLQQFDPMGVPFDPTAHEALSQMPVEDPALHGRVVKVVRHGYRFQSRVLRPAQVLVGHHPDPPSPPDQNDEEAPETDASPSS